MTSENNYTFVCAKCSAPAFIAVRDDYMDGLLCLDHYREHEEFRRQNMKDAKDGEE
jgi:hypothetical protein